MNAQRAVRCRVVAVLGFLLAGASPAAAQPEVLGQWSDADPVDWDEDAEHAIHSPLQKILIWKRVVSSDGDNTAQLWDPFAGTLTYKPMVLPHLHENMDCSGHAALQNGNVLIAGGFTSSDVDKLTHEFTAAGEWLELDPQTSYMNFPRFYPTLVTLPDGTILALGGEDLVEGFSVVTPEIYNDLSKTWTPLPSAVKALGNYPYAFVLPDGDVAVVGALDPCPAAQIEPCDLFVTKVLDVSTSTWWDGPERNSPVQFNLGSAVMYEPGRVLIAGGRIGFMGTRLAVTETIDFTIDPLAWTWTLEDPMLTARSDHDLVLLPDGKILAVGGRTLINNVLVAVFAPEWFEPNPGPGMDPFWEPLAEDPEQVPRLGHSTSFLLPDATVVTAGDNPVKIFSPPYLFGGWRPIIVSAPGVVGYNQDFSVVLESTFPPSELPNQPPELVEDTIDKVTLVRLAAVTHGFDQNQRYVELLLNHVSGNTLSVTSPLNARLAPPGYYMLFVVSDDGVPSVARYIQLYGTGLQLP